MIDSGTVPITLNITNFTLDPAAIGATTNVPGTGHYHVYLDNVYQKADGYTTTFLANLADGSHAIRIELSQNNHTELAINAAVSVTINSGSPRVQVTSPATGIVVNSSSVEIRIWKDNFTYAPGAVGQANVAGEGHYHVNVDGNYFWYGTEDFFNVSELGVGSKHTIRVALHNNDHTPVAPAVFDEIVVDIPADAPSLVIWQFLFDKQVNASSVEIPLTITNFVVNPLKVGQAPVAGEGHYHAWLDDVFLGPQTDNPLLLSDLSVGPHVLVIELMNNDHSPLLTPVMDWTQFTVLAISPRVTITSPTNPSTINSPSLLLTFTVGNFTLDAANIGSSTNAAGSGHWHVYADGVYLEYGAGLSVEVKDLAAGRHIISIELQNNDHSDLTWPAFDWVAIAVPSDAPRIEITSPSDGAAVNSTSLVVEVSVSNLALNASAIGLAAKAGEGHWHVFVDGEYKANTAATSIAVYDLAPGKTYTIRVELRNNDHSELAQPVFDWVKVTIPAGALSIVITIPADASIVELNWTWVVVHVANFTLDAANIGASTNVNGTGHWHLFVDGAYKDNTAASSMLIVGLASGTHVVRVELHNNDHSLVTPAVFDEATVTVNGKIPSVSVTSPSANAIIYGEAVSVTASVANFTLEDFADKTANVNGHGHIHFVLDGVLKNMTHLTTAVLGGLTPGSHTITVSLAEHDHTDLALSVSASVTIVVLKIPTITITSPAAGLQTAERSVELKISVTDFTLDAAAIGSPTNAAGRGHYHVFVDDVYVGAGAGANFTVQNLTVGSHTLRVELHNNDHSIIPGAAPASIQVTVTSPPPPPPKGFLPGFGAVETLAAVGVLAAAFVASRRMRRSGN